MKKYLLSHLPLLKHAKRANEPCILVSSLKNNPQVAQKKTKPYSLHMKGNKLGKSDQDRAIISTTKIDNKKTK